MDKKINNKIEKFLKREFKEGRGKDFLEEEDIKELITDGFIQKKLKENNIEPVQKKSIYGLVCGTSYEEDYLQIALQQHLVEVHKYDINDICKKERNSGLEVNLIGKKNLGIDCLIEKDNIYIEIKDYNPESIKAGIGQVEEMNWILSKKYNINDFGVYLAVPYTAGKKIQKFIDETNKTRKSKIGLILLREKPQDTIVALDPKKKLKSYK